METNQFTLPEWWTKELELKIVKEQNVTYDEYRDYCKIMEFMEANKDFYANKVINCSMLEQNNHMKFCNRMHKEMFTIKA
jgi:hypothetical protein